MRSKSSKNMIANVFEWAKGKVLPPKPPAENNMNGKDIVLKQVAMAAYEAAVSGAIKSCLRVHGNSLEVAMHDAYEAACKELVSIMLVRADLVLSAYLEKREIPYNLIRDFEPCKDLSDDEIIDFCYGVLAFKAAFLDENKGFSDAIEEIVEEVKMEGKEGIE